MVLTCIDMPQCGSKGSEDEDHAQVNIDENNAGFKMLLKNQLYCKYFMRKEMHLTHLLELKDTHTHTLCVLVSNTPRGSFNT